MFVVYTMSDIKHSLLAVDECVSILWSDLIVFEVVLTFITKYSARLASLKECILV